MPWRGVTPYVVAGVVEPVENSTQRIPEAVLGPYLRWALFYVQVAAGDILAASDELARLQRNVSGGESAVKLATWIAGRRQAGRGVPSQVWPRDPGHHVVASQLVAHMAGLRHSAYIDGPACQRLLADAVTELGFEPGGMDTAVSVDPLTGRPWRERFSPRELVTEKRLLQAACYIVCTYLSGIATPRPRSYAGAATPWSAAPTA